MAFQLANAYVEFSERGASGVMGAVAGIGAQLTSMKGLALGAMGALGGLVGVAGAGGLLKLAADAESTAVSMEVMLGSAEKAAALIEEVSKMDKVTPFSKADLIDATKTLLNFGVAGEQILPALDKLGNVAAGDAQKLQSLAVVFGQVASAGRMTGQDLMQFINAGFNPLLVLSQKTGESMDSLREKMSKGQIGIDAVAAAFNAATAEGGQFFQMNVKQSMTLGGAWNAVTGTLEAVFAKIGTALAEGFGLTDIIGRMEGFVNDFEADWMPAIVASIGWVREKIIELEPTWNAIATVVGAVAKIMLSTIPPIVVGIVDWITANQELLMGIGLVAGAIIGLPALFSAALPVLIGGFAALQAGIIALVSPIGLVVVGVTALGFVFKDFFIGVAQWLFDVIKHWEVAWPLMYESAKLQISNLWERIKTFGINVVEVVQWFGRNWFNIMRDYVMMQVAVVQNLWENIKNGWQALVDWIAGKPVQFEWTPLLEGFKATVENLPELTKANVQRSNAEIDRLAAEFERRRNPQETVNEAAAKASAGPGELSFDAAGGAAADKGKNKKGAEFVGLAQLAEKMQQEASKASNAKRQEAIAERQAAAAEKLADKAEGDGLKVHVVNMGAPGGVDPAFG